MPHSADRLQELKIFMCDCILECRVAGNRTDPFIATNHHKPLFADPT